MRLATVTPLASIFGSGFLIIIPILERELGALAAVGMAGVCLVAWMVGIAIRHNVAVVEPLADAGGLDPTTVRIDRASDLVIVVAYVISVALYLRILALFVVGYVSSGSGASERLLAVILVALITAAQCSPAKTPHSYSAAACISPRCPVPDSSRCSWCWAAS